MQKNVAAWLRAAREATWKCRRRTTQFVAATGHC